METKGTDVVVQSRFSASGDDGLFDRYLIWGNKRKEPHEKDVRLFSGGSADDYRA
jgi:hypothetical protein